MKKVLILMMSLLMFFSMTLTTTFAEDKSTDITYEAPYTITLYDDGITYVIQIYSGEVLKEPSHTSKTGYNFLGWYVKDTDTKWNFDTVITEEISLEARYEKKEEEKKSSSKSSSKSNTTTSTSGYQLISTDAKGVTRDYGFGIGSTIICGGLCIYVMTRKKRDDD